MAKLAILEQNDHSYGYLTLPEYSDEYSNTVDKLLKSSKFQKVRTAHLCRCLRTSEVE